MMKRFLQGLTGFISGFVPAAVYYAILDDLIYVLPADYIFPLAAVSGFLVLTAINILIYRRTKNKLKTFASTFLFFAEILDIIVLFMFTLLKYFT